MRRWSRGWGWDTNMEGTRGGKQKQEGKGSGTRFPRF